MDAKETIAELRRELQSIFNRIHSIAEDAAFIKQVHDHYPDLPLLPNLRCGAWYTDPKIASTERVYFKSTDGHTNNWSFNLRRPNLHILSLIANHAGLVLVDSTRAGKRIPDAFSKTVPIWCSVVNRAILARDTETRFENWDVALYTPPGSVSPQEHSQIESKLDGWASELAASSYSLPTLKRPLRPMWITPATAVFPTLLKLPDCTFYPIVCVSASKQVVDGMEHRATGFAYIQGSGDDHELWSMGLTPNLYWRHLNEILAIDPSDLPVFVRSLVSASSHVDNAMDPNQPPCGAPVQHVAGRISICNVASLRRRPNLLQTHPNVAFLCCTPDNPTDMAGPLPKEASRMLNFQIPTGKKGQHHFLATVLPRSMPYIQHHLQNERSICIACNTGTDTSVGVGVAALGMFFRSDGSFLPQGVAHSEISKDVLKIRLQWIISSCPQANPSRTTLKRVNDFLLSPFSSPLMPNTPSHHNGASARTVATLGTTINITTS